MLAKIACASPGDAMLLRPRNLLVRDLGSFVADERMHSATADLLGVRDAWLSVSGDVWLIALGDRREVRSQSPSALSAGYSLDPSPVSGRAPHPVLAAHL